MEHRKIKELPKHVADKIAAGEVVDRPLSIVKELVENAIDAEATKIVIEIKNGGKTYIRVSDNGFGIPREEISLAFKRHATSKITSDSDLMRIHTLGFRGEALASICAVSKTTLISKPATAAAGAYILIEGGEILEEKEVGAENGTSIIVENLFYNLPARFKFLKADSREASIIIDFISKMTLAYKNIQFRLINNGNVLFSTKGDNDIYKNILEIFSKDFGNQLIPLQFQDRDISIEAYISSPQHTKSTRKNQIFFVNGRYVTSKIIEKGITNAYKEKLFHGRYPTAIVFLTVDPNKLDVNIHPNKKEIRFSEENRVEFFVEAAIATTLKQKEAVTEVKNTLKKEEKNHIEDSEQININKLSSTKNNIENAINNSVDSESPRGNQNQVFGNLHENNEPYLSNSEKTESTPLTDELYDFSAASSTSSTVSFEIGTKKANFDPHQMSNDVDLDVIFDVDEVKLFNISELEVTGVIFNTYITAVAGDDFFLIDQHAAHERLFYEKYLEQYKNQNVVTQGLINPLVLDIPFSVKEDLKLSLDILRKTGFEIEEFGPKAYLIKAIPMFMSISESEHFLDDFIENIENLKDFKDAEKIKKIIMNSCKSAVKAHDKLSADEINYLMRDLALAKNPYTCPHGRPVFVKFSKYEIERMFKRI